MMWGEAKRLIMPIDGAVTLEELPDKTADGQPQYRFSPFNSEYTVGMWYDDLLWASKDGRKFQLVVAVKHNGQEITAHDMREAAISE